MLVNACRRFLVLLCFGQLVEVGRIWLVVGKMHSELLIFVSLEKMNRRYFACKGRRTRARAHVSRALGLTRASRLLYCVSCYKFCFPAVARIEQCTQAQTSAEGRKCACAMKAVNCHSLSAGSAIAARLAIKDFEDAVAKLCHACNQTEVAFVPCL